MRLSEDDKLRRAYEGAWLRTIDGKPLYTYARMLALDARHVAGADIVPMLLDQLEPARHRMFFVVADEKLAEKLMAWAIHRGFDQDAIGIAVPPMGFEGRSDYQEQLAERVFAHRASHLFMGIGCPRSEIWVDKFSHRLGNLYALSVGAALAFHVGTMQRAPQFLRVIGMEWLWRVKEEPRRLAKRYFVRSWGFSAILLRDLSNRIWGRGGYDLGIHSRPTYHRLNDDR